MESKLSKPSHLLWNQAPRLPFPPMPNGTKLSACTQTSFASRNCSLNNRFRDFEDSENDFVFTVHRKAGGNVCFQYCLLLRLCCWSFLFLFFFFFFFVAQPSCGTVTLSKHLHFFETDKFIDQWVVLDPDPAELAREKEKQKGQEKLGDIRLTLRLTVRLLFHNAFGMLFCKLTFRWFSRKLWSTI